jgi:uncharacterized protein YecE (DUF72 family)
MIYVGTCGFSYKDWIGSFYPSGTKAQAMLGLYAKRFDAVEIDSTYYAIPKPSLFDSIARRTPAGFRFSVKAPGSITHLPVDAQPAAADIETFGASVAPLVAAGKLGVVLAQFPHSFQPSKEARSRLALLRDRWPDLPLVAEFRHRDWQKPAVLRELRALDVGWCNVDEPMIDTLLRPSAESTSRVGYMRFHGRNAAKWWKQDRSAAERYDYLYSATELSEWLPRIARVEHESEETYVFFNNHRNGQAATNARQMAEMLGVGHRPLAPAVTQQQLSLLDDAARRKKS